MNWDKVIQLLEAHTPEALLEAIHLLLTTKDWKAFGTPQQRTYALVWLEPVLIALPSKGRFPKSAALEEVRRAFPALMTRAEYENWRVEKERERTEFLAAHPELNLQTTAPRVEWAEVKRELEAGNDAEAIRLGREAIKFSRIPDDLVDPLLAAIDRINFQDTKAQRETIEKGKILAEGGGWKYPCARGHPHSSVDTALKCEFRYERRNEENPKE